MTSDQQEQTARKAGEGKIVGIVRVELVAHCVCGASMNLGAPYGFARQVLALWAEEHTGEGHGDCDAKTARKARLALLNNKQGAVRS